MKEILFVLLVIIVLIGFTALRFRRYITGLIGMARMLKDVKDQAGQSRTIRGEQPSVQLVNCAKCGVWVPQNKAISRQAGYFYCSNECLQTAQVRG